VRSSKIANGLKMKPTGRAVLDTSAVIALFAGEPSARAAIEAQQEIMLPVTALGELYYGAYRSTRRENNLALLVEFAQRVAVLHCDAVTARVYGETKAALAAKGRPIPENDLWIAALACGGDYGRFPLR
jgi:tRNA(fMet)-specific endonuclease VapC